MILHISNMQHIANDNVISMAYQTHQQISKYFTN